jgi:hypothetical protein
MSPEPTSPTLAAALEAYSRGWTPIPLRPARKAPVFADWPATKYDAPDEVHARWNEAAATRNGGGSPDALGVGIALGAPSGGLVDVDLDHPKARKIAPFILPPTPMRSGRASSRDSHWWYLVSDDSGGVRKFSLPKDLRPGAEKEAVIEYRTTGGQTVIPPSRHEETGETLLWEDEPWGGADGPTVIEAAQLHVAVRMIAFIVILAESWPGKGRRHEAYLPLVGWLLRDADPETGAPKLHEWWDGQIAGLIAMLADLTHDSDGASARLHETVHTTRRRILAGKPVQGWPTLAGILGESNAEVIREHLHAIEELGEMQRARRRSEWYSADLRVVDEPGVVPNTASPEAAQNPDGVKDPLARREWTWEQVDVRDYVLGGIEPPKAGVWHRSDGVGLLYPGRVNSLYGTAGSGKTLIALEIARQCMAAGETVAMLDFEDEPHNTLDRLQNLGVTDDDLIERFLYLHPEEPTADLQMDRWGLATSTETGRANRTVFDNLLAQRDPSLIIVDGVTTLYSLHGLNTNDAGHADAIGRWLRRLTDHNRRTTLLIDHTPKGSAPGATPMGSQHKVSMVQGTALQVYTLTKPRIGAKGEAALYVGKDRPGRVLMHSNHDDPPLVGQVVFDGETKGGGKLDIYVKLPGQVIVTSPMPRTSGRPAVDTSKDPDAVLGFFRSTGAGELLTRTEVEAAVSLPTGRIKDALRVLLDSGDIVQEGAGRSTAYTLKV